MGQNSGVMWLQKLKQDTKLGNPTDDYAQKEFGGKTGDASPLFFDRSPDSKKRKTFPDALEGFSISDSSYHLDDFSVFVPDTVNPYEFPPEETADRLFNTYLNSVHPSFPIIGKITFSSQYKKFAKSSASSPGEKWLIILNMIFAIEANYSHLIQAEW